MRLDKLVLFITYISSYFCARPIALTNFLGNIKVRNSNGFRIGAQHVSDGFRVDKEQIHFSSLKNLKNTFVGEVLFRELYRLKNARNRAAVNSFRPCASSEVPPTSRPMATSPAQRSLDQDIRKVVAERRV